METFEILSNILNIQPPVSFEEFCRGKNFCNDPYIYDYWIEKYTNAPEHCTEVIAKGALGSGKSFAAAKYQAYRMYKLFRCGDPRPRFKLKPGSPLYGFYFSTSLSVAKKSGFKYLQEAYETCNWFKKNMPVDPNLSSIISFPSADFEIGYASSDAHVIGLNVCTFVLDEANFRKGVGLGIAEEYEEVVRIYEQLMDRMSSRFSTPEGVEFLAELISSASYQSAFTERRSELIKDSPQSLIIDAVTYEVKPEQFSKETFEVFIGYGVVDPCIIESKEQKDRIISTCKLDSLGDVEKFFKNPPVTLIESFKNNIVQALQNHCGVPVNVKGKFLTNPKFLLLSYDDTLPEYFSSNTLVASTEDDTELIEYFIPENVVFGENPHSMFLDLSLKDDTGSLVCYRFDGLNNEGMKMQTRVFSLRIVPPPAPAATRIQKIVNLVVALSEFLNIQAFGSDNFQSVGVRQDVQAALGLDDIRLSLDSTDVPYIAWLKALVDGRIRQAPDPDLRKEAEQADHDYKRHRVIKPKHGSDDQLQGNVGALFLSDTVGSTNEDISAFYSGGNINLVGPNSVNKLMKNLGYQTNS